MNILETYSFVTERGWGRPKWWLDILDIVHFAKISWASPAANYAEICFENWARILYPETGPRAAQLKGGVASTASRQWERWKRRIQDIGLGTVVEKSEGYTKTPRKRTIKTCILMDLQKSMAVADLMLLTSQIGRSRILEFLGSTKSDAAIIRKIESMKMSMEVKEEDYDEELVLQRIAELQRRNPILMVGNPSSSEEAAGILPICPTTGRILLALRSRHVNDPLVWSGCGGKIDPGEDPETAALREMKEELKYSGPINLIEAFVFTTPGDDFRYYHFIGLVNKEFKPRLDWETQEAHWLTLDEMLSLRDQWHPGFESFWENSENIIRLYAR